MKNLKGKKLLVIGGAFQHCKVVETAVKGMLPKNSMGRKQITRLHVYKDANHNQTAQKPELIALKGVIE